MGDKLGDLEYFKRFGCCNSYIHLLGYNLPSGYLRDYSVVASVDAVKRADAILILDRFCMWLFFHLKTNEGVAFRMFSIHCPQRSVVSCV